MPPVTRARRRLIGAMLSALAGGGLTAVVIGPASNALATGTTPGPASGDATATSATETTPSQETTATTPATTTTAAAPATPATTTTETATAPTTTTTATPPAEEAPTVVLQRTQKSTASPVPQTSSRTEATTGKSKSKTETENAANNNVAASPQSVAASESQLAAMLASSEASAASLAFYRIPLFLLPIYKAAAVQYGVPWQILAAINEIETDYGSDLSVSSAGAVGWMQFMPSTWLQYGVDALDAGYADPYNPVDAIFAAARYLRAAGAAKDLRKAILAYNHSEEYVDSVLLRAELISTYPKAVIATLTGLIDGRLPVTGATLAWEALPSATLSASSATANAAAVPDGAGKSAGTGATEPLSPTAAASAATAKSAATAHATDFDVLTASPNAKVVAVQDGRVVKIGDSAKLGRYIVLRDVYGDVFTYAGLGSIASTYELPREDSATQKSKVVEAASSAAPAPSQAASAGTQEPTTLSVSPAQEKGASDGASASSGSVSIPHEAAESADAAGKVRLFAHPSNPDARAAAAVARTRRARQSAAGQRQPLRVGSVVATGTVLGKVSVPSGAKDGHLRFAIQPSGDPGTVDPGPILANWAQLQASLHPKGARATNALLGATASDVFLLSKAQLQRAVLSDPGIKLDACARQDVASGALDKRLLAVLAFLSRSGLKPTVGGLSCAAGEYASTGARANAADALSITAINGVSIAGHQGPGTIADLTVRTLLTLPHGFVPSRIVSLMRYPGEANTSARSAYWNQIRVIFKAQTAEAALNPADTARAAHSAATGRTAPSPLVSTETLSLSQWNSLLKRIAALPAPKVSTTPSSAAIPDRKRP